MDRLVTFKSLFGAILCVCTINLLFFAAPSMAQTPTAEQLQQLEQLTPKQREQLLDALGGSSSALVRDKQLQTTGPLVVPEAPVPKEAALQSNRLAPHDSLIIGLTSKTDKKPELDSINSALGRNVYVLDHQGYLNFPGIGRFLLSGLTSNDAQLRLYAVPEFRGLNISVDLLPIEKVGSVALEPYGVELFSGAPTTFAPATDIPVPADYIVGPGDEISLQMFGQQNAQYLLVVGRDGQINIPEIGPVAVSGMRFNQLREELTKRIEERYIGVTLSVTTGKLRSVRVFVLGDVNQPGSYTVSGLSTMTNALFVSGGIARSGSMRKIQLKRSNRVVGTLDLYDLLLKGNTRNDRRMQPGDVIYVPPVGPQVSVYGEVNRPAIYEINPGLSLQSVIELAGGIQPSASKQDITIERFGDTNGKSVRVVNLDTESSTIVQAGDQIEVTPSLSQITDGIYVRGHLKRETTRQWRQGTRLLDVIPDARMFKVQADQSYVLIRREFKTTGLVELISADWRAAFQDPASTHNIELRAGDVVHVFSLAGDRAAKIAPMLAEVQAQTSTNVPSKIVVVNGRVRAPGVYPFEANMTVSDLVRAAGSTLDNAYLIEAELTRTFIDANGRNSTHIQFNLEESLSGVGEDQILEPYDVLTIKEIPQWSERQEIELIGEVKFPGKYSASRGERLSEVIERAGGLTAMAFTRGSIFLREDLKERERVQMEKLSQRIRTQLSAFTDTQAESRTRAMGLLTDLEKTEPVGRLVIDLNLVLQGDPEHDVVLENGDQLVIPPISQEITVIGEVQYPTSHIYESDLDQLSYMYKSGGATPNADMKHIYIIRADGNVVSQRGGNWFRRSGGSLQVLPGDTIVVPFDADRISKLSLWQSVSQIIYNIGVSAAAVASF